jgi:glycosyltransferase involved in cell wall biosynthesis
MKKRVVHIALGKANPERMNGVNKVIYHLGTEQFRKGVDVEFWGITKSTLINFPKRELPTRLFEDIGKFQLAKELKKAIKEEKSSTVFHLHGGFIPQLALVARLLRKRGIAYHYTPHGSFNEVALMRSKWKKKIYIKLFENKLVRKARRVHLIGKSEVRGTLQLFGKVPHVLIPNGQAAPVTSQRPAPSQSRPTKIVFVGRLDIHTKGLDILLEAASKARAADFTIHLIGDGPGREELEQTLISQHMSDRVFLDGALFGSEKDEKIEHSDYLILNSRNEGLPGVVLEALSLGTPVIVSEETNMGDYVKAAECGFVIPKNDPLQLAETLLQAIEFRKNGEWNEMSKRAKKLIEKEFSWEKIADKHLESYA